MSDSYELPDYDEIGNFTKEMLLSDDVLTAFCELVDPIEKARYSNALTDRARELKCATAFKKLLEAFQKTAAAIANKNRGTEVVAIGHYGTFNQGAWTISETEGISSYNMFGTVVACPHIVVPIRRFTNIETNDEMVTLAYQRRGDIYREITVKRSVIASASKIVDVLSAKGIAVTSENARALVKFLNDFENLNFELIPVQRSTSKLGWKDGSFVPFDDKDIIFDGEAKFQAAYDALQPCGDYDEWLAHMRVIRSEGKLANMLYLAASFASILIEPLDALPFILDIYGASGRGKTVALMMACSVWANPKDGEYINAANSTLTALELRLNFLNHLPMLTDDMAQLKLFKNEDFSDFIYRVCSGKGKSRGNANLTVDALTTWANITLTNAERPLTVDGMKGGAINRIIDVPIGEEPLFKDGNAEANFFKNNYGHAGIKFINIVKQVGIDIIRQICDEIRKQIIEEGQRRNEVKEEKQILPMSILLATDLLIEKYIFKDEKSINFGEAFDLMKSVKEVSENERAWEYLMEVITMNSGQFIDAGLTKDGRGPDMSPNTKVWGKMEDGGTKCIIMKDVLDRELKNGGFDSNMLLRWAVQNGKAIPGKDGRPTVNQRIMPKVAVKCARLILSQDDGWQDASEENIPFK